jgi:sugar phosphate isomerase/epimerase
MYMVGREILQDVVDMHVHSGPSIVARSLDTVEMLRQAEEAGYKGFVVKDHYIPTVMSAAMIEKYHAKKGTRVIGSVVLNNSIGVFNVSMIDAAYKMGAKVVWMPTVSAKQHIDAHAAKSFVGAKKLAVAEKPVYYLNDSGELNEAVLPVLDYMASHPDMVLATGHGSVAEIDKLVAKAAEMNVDKIVITHPFSTVSASVDDVKRWAGKGAYVDVCAVEFEQILPTLSRIPFSLITEYLSVVPQERLILSSDGGAMTRNGPVSPVDILYRFLSLLYENKILTGNQIDLMAKKTPAALLGM